MASVNLTLNRFAVPNMPTFDNAFGVKKPGVKQGLSTAENVINTMLPFLRQRPVEISQTAGTSAVEANASVFLTGNIASLTLGEGAYKGVELLIFNDANGDVALNDKTRTLTTRIGETITLRWNGDEWRVKHDKFVGDIIQQLPSEKNPIEKWLEGKWLNWSARAVMYNISDTPPASFVDYYTLVGTVIAANATPLVMYHVSGSDYQLFKFKAAGAAYTVPQELDPVKWDEIKSNTTVFREACQKLSYRDESGNITVTPDLPIGSQITEGNHTGKYITAIYVLGGKFLSIEGGFRPPFGGGVQGDVQRPLTGRIHNIINAGGVSPSGAFSIISGAAKGTGDYSGSYYSAINFDSGLVVKTANENSPRTTSTNVWRRIA